MTEAILKRMMLPINESISKISENTGITEPTLYKWRKEALINGNAIARKGLTRVF